MVRQEGTSRGDFPPTIDGEKEVNPIRGSEYIGYGFDPRTMKLRDFQIFDITLDESRTWQNPEDPSIIYNVLDQMIAQDTPESLIQISKWYFCDESCGRLVEKRIAYKRIQWILGYQFRI